MSSQVDSSAFMPGFGLLNSDLGAYISGVKDNTGFPKPDPTHSLVVSAAAPSQLVYYHHPQPT